MVRWKRPAAWFVPMALLALACPGARADTAIRLLQSHVGNVNFVGTQETIRDKGNKQPCRVSSPTVDRYATLTGIPATAEILSAQLYWAGSGYNPDFNVIMDGGAISAPSDRRYYSTTIGNNYNYFSGAADVTEQVKLKRNSTYAFRGLTVDYDSPYCAVEGVLGGFSLLVIYSDTSEPFRMLNLYEGFQYMRYSSFTLNLSGFRVPDPIGTATGRVGHITWEGDATLDGSEENLKFNGYEMTDSRNPSGNQFNSKSNINGDGKSYGIDFDAYTVGSPVIKSGQTTASTRYESGQDLVMLSAEVVALPNIPLADLSIAMQLDGALALGKDASYTIRVTNSGPSIASSPNVVTSTLPTGLSYVSGSGTGWACSSVGQDVTCTSNTAVTAGSSLSALTLTVRVTGTGTIATSALVTGKTYDPQTANNAVTVSANVADGSGGFVFTSGACVPDIPFGDKDQKCTKVLPEVRAGVPTPIFITAVGEGEAAEVPKRMSARTTVSMQFALSCHNPPGPASPVGVAASFAGATLKLCKDKGELPTDWSGNTDITFEANTASVEKTFKYEDVGEVQLFMLSGPKKTLGQSQTFVSVPYEIRLTKKSGGAFADAALSESSEIFISAGLSFDLVVGAYAYVNDTTRKLAPNFGQERPTKVAFDTPTTAKGAAKDTDAWKAMADTVAALKDEEAFGTVSAGGASGKFSWPDVGVIKLTPRLNTGDYLLKPVTFVDAYIGRFVPHHFTTAAKRMDCLPNMKCDADISTAAYSREQIPVTVSAMAAGDTVTKNYRGVFARDVALTAWAGAARDQAMSGLTDGHVQSAGFSEGKAEALPKYDLLNAFNYAAPQSAWSAPTSIYLRAIEKTGSDAVTSKSDKGTFEAGVKIVSGRLLVPSTYGSERLSLPLRVSAQYWTGTHWELSSKDQQNIVDPAKAVFSNFGGLSLSVAPTAPQKLSNGVANFGVKVAPALSGKADLIIDHIEWLPSTKGRLKFGTYKSPLIYLRELH